MPRTAMPRTAAPATFPTKTPAAASLGGWECAWCTDFAAAADRRVGPDGPSSLCVACGSSFEDGPEGGTAASAGDEAAQTSAGKGSKSGLRLQPASGSEPEPEPEEAWECHWCTEHEEYEDRRSGPDGPSTLCRTCAAELDAPSQGGAPLTLEEAHTAAPHDDAIVDRVSREAGEQRVARQEPADAARGGSGGGKGGSAGKQRRKKASPRSPASLQSQQRRRQAGRPTGRRRGGDPARPLWRCEWCESGDSDTEDHHEGPSGSESLCDTCSHAFQGNRAERPSPLPSPLMRGGVQQQPMVAGEPAAAARVANAAEAKLLADPDAAALAERMRHKLAAKQAKDTAAQRDESAEQRQDRLLDTALEAKAQLLELSDFNDDQAGMDPMSAIEAASAADRLLGLEPGATARQRGLALPPPLPLSPGGRASHPKTQVSALDLQPVSPKTGPPPVSPRLAAAAARFHSPYHGRSPTKNTDPTSPKSQQQQQPPQSLNGSLGGSAALLGGISGIAATTSGDSTPGGGSAGMASIVTQLTAIQAADRWLAKVRFYRYFSQPHFLTTFPSLLVSTSSPVSRHFFTTFPAHFLSRISRCRATWRPSPSYSPSSPRRSG